MSFRSFLRRTLLGATALGLVAATNGASAQTPIPPIPGLPPGVPPIPPGVPTIPGIPPGMPGGPPAVPSIPGLPPIPNLPAPGGTPAVPSIPGLPGLKLFSPTGALLMPFMRDEAKKIYEKQRAALPPTERAAVEGIPFLFEDNKEEVNAFAGCDDSGKKFVVVTAGMYQILDLVAQARATDETFGTQYYSQYVDELSRQQVGKAQILPLPPGMLDVTKSLNQRKLQRQRQLFQEMAAYVIGHELAHHYRGHLGSVCTGGGGGTLKPGDIVRMATKVVKAINQAVELDADLHGTHNILRAGQNESEYKWSAGGALRVLDFFEALDKGGPLFSFTKSHPHPKLRKPFVYTVAECWRLTNPAAKVDGPALASEWPMLSFPQIPGLPGTMYPQCRVFDLKAPAPK
jgi:hypothetical protein